MDSTSRLPLSSYQPNQPLVVRIANNERESEPSSKCKSGNLWPQPSVSSLSFALNLSLSLSLSLSRFCPPTGVLIKGKFRFDTLVTFFEPSDFLHFCKQCFNVEPKTFWSKILLIKVALVKKLSIPIFKENQKCCTSIRDMFMCTLLG